MKGSKTGNPTGEARLTSAGLLLFISGFVIFMGIITGEMLLTSIPLGLLGLKDVSHIIMK